MKKLLPNLIVFILALVAVYIYSCVTNAEGAIIAPVEPAITMTQTTLA